MTDINDAVDHIVSSISYFKKSLEKTQLQHTDTEAFAEIVRDFASWVIALRMSDDAEKGKHSHNA